MAPPKVFISYSHDSPAHQAKVLALADRFRGHGIDVVVDQYEPFPRSGWIQWMNHQVRDTQFILVVCTETYRRRWDADEQADVGLGATYERGLIQQLLHNAGGVNEKFVPLLLNDGDAQHIPLDLQRYTRYPVYTQEGYEGLYRLLTNQPKDREPILGQPLPIREAKPDFQNYFWNAPPRNPFFTGRAMHLETIRKALTKSAAAVLTQPHAISDLGGIGKTQTAIEYAHLYRANYAAVLWSGADSRDSLLSGFAAFANLLDLPQKHHQDLSVVAAAVRHWLESNSGWLLVLDNVEDLTLIPQFAHVGAQGHLLITTRLRSTGEFADAVELQKMEPEESALFLLRRAKIILQDKSLKDATEVYRTLARQISMELDGLPLALDQAGSFIEETPSTLAEYLSLYSVEGNALRARRGKLSQSHPSVTITFSMAFARLADANPAAADMVRGCAFLAPDAIPEEIFTQAGREWGELIAEAARKPLAWAGAIEGAGRFALIRRDAENKSLQIHRLAQEVVKDEMNAATRCGWAERVVGALNEVFPNSEFQNWPQCERLLPHARIAARLIEDFGLGSTVAARLLNKVGHYLNGRAQYTEAEPLLRRALAISEKALGAEHWHTASILNNLAQIYFNQGRYHETEPLLRRVLAISEKASGPEHTNTASILNNLALLYYNQGHYSEAEPVYRRVLAISEKASGPEHPRTATSLSNLGHLYCVEGRYREAEPLLLRALAIQEKELGHEHPSTASSLNLLAELYRDQGRHTEGEPLCQRALAIREKALGHEHPSTAISLDILAELYRNQGRYAEAEPLYCRALAIREKVLGHEHQHTATSLNNLAMLYHNQGRYPEAEPLYRRALAIYEKSLGPEHPSTASVLNNLAQLYYSQGRYHEAEPLYRRALTIRETVLGPDHPHTATIIRSYGELLRRLGHQAEAEKLEARVKAKES